MNKTIYTDGGCKGDYDPDKVGTWAYVVLDGFNITLDSIPENTNARLALSTTNNRMEMMAVIEAIESQPYGTNIRIFSDSGYVVNGINDPNYLKKWQQNGWKTSAKKPVENKDLWLDIVRILDSKKWQLQFSLVRGHNKNSNPVHNKFNTMCDKICTEIMDSYIMVRDRRETC